MNFRFISKLYFDYLAIFLFSTLLLGCGKEKEKLRETESQTIETMEKVKRNLAASSDIVNSRRSLSQMSKDDYDRIFIYNSNALRNAKKVDTDFLDKKISGWGQKYRELLIHGLSVRVEGWREGNNQKIAKGTLLVESYKDWHERNLHKIRNLVPY